MALTICELIGSAGYFFYKGLAASDFTVSLTQSYTATFTWKVTVFFLIETFTTLSTSNDLQKARIIFINFVFIAVPTTAVQARLENGGEKKGFTQELLILIICAGVGGVILITIVLAFIFTRFYR